MRGWKIAGVESPPNDLAAVISTDQVESAIETATTTPITPTGATAAAVTRRDG